MRAPKPGCQVRDANSGACASPAAHGACCQFPLRGRKAGQVCGIAVCRTHARYMPGDALKTFVCPSHARWVAANGMPAARAA